MENRVNTDLQSFIIIYNRNKHYIIPFIVIFICIGLILQILIPQFKTLSEVKEEAEKASQRLTELKEDLNILSNLDEGILESQLKTTTFALPINKEFGGILNALYSAANSSGVNIGKFSFQVGDLAKSDQKDTKFPFINLTISIGNDVEAVNNFINRIGKTLPISDVSFVKIDNKISTLSLLFYYKFLPVSDVQKDVRILPITNEKLLLFSKISDFNSALSGNLSSQSATATVPFVKSSNPFSL